MISRSSAFSIAAFGMNPQPRPTYNGRRVQSSERSSILPRGPGNIRRLRQPSSTVRRARTLSTKSVADSPSPTSPTSSGVCIWGAVLADTARKIGVGSARRRSSSATSYTSSDPSEWPKNPNGRSKNMPIELITASTYTAISCTGFCPTMHAPIAAVRRCSRRRGGLIVCPVFEV